MHPRLACQGFESVFRVGLRNSGDAKLLAAVLFDISQLALALGDYDRTIRRASEAAQIDHQASAPEAEALAVNTTGLARLYRGDYELALKDFQTSLSLHDKAGDTDGKVARLNNIGNVYFYQGKYLNALQSYEQALGLTQQANGKPWRARRMQLTLANIATQHLDLA